MKLRMLKHGHKPARARGGFTLIEVLLVVAILGILATVVVVNFAGRQEKAMIRACRASIANISTAVDMYEVDTGRYPRSLENLITDDGAPNWTGPYLRGGVPQDPWGQPFEYTRTDNGYKIQSPGPPGENEPITGFDF